MLKNVFVIILRLGKKACNQIESWILHIFVCIFAKPFYFQKIYERGYFRSISSGRDFQFFSAHFFSKSRTDTRVGAFDRYTLPTYWKIIEKSCNFF